MISELRTGRGLTSTVRAFIAAFSIKCRFFVCNRNIWEIEVWESVGKKVEIFYWCRCRRFSITFNLLILSWAVICWGLPISWCYKIRPSPWHPVTNYQFISASTDSTYTHDEDYFDFLRPGSVWLRVCDVNTQRHFLKGVKNCGQKKKPPALPHTAFLFLPIVPKHIIFRAIPYKPEICRLYNVSRGPRSLLFIVCHYSLWRACVRLYLNNAFFPSMD